MDYSDPTNNSKVTFDPGWNDPPTLSYNMQQSQSSRPRNFLNKRVAFPLSNTNQPTSMPLENLTPNPVAYAQLPLPIQVRTFSPNDNNEAVNINSEELLIEVKTILMEILENNSELERKAEDIQRRITVMEEMWLGGKLNNNIQFQMKELALALRENDPHKADVIHRALMVDHISTVSTWMPGVKQLVHNSIARSELLAIDDNSDLKTT